MQTYCSAELLRGLMPWRGLLRDWAGAAATAGAGAAVRRLPHRARGRQHAGARQQAPVLHVARVL